MGGDTGEPPGAEIALRQETGYSDGCPFALPRSRPMRKHHVALTALLFVGAIAGAAWSFRRPTEQRLMCTMRIIQDGTRTYTICAIEPAPEQ